MPQPQEDLKVTPLEAWEDSPEGFIVQLPESGHFVRVKRTLDMMTMLKAGMIPNPLGRKIREMIAQGAQGTFDISGLSDDALDQMMELQDRIVVSCMTEPKISAPEPKSKDETAVQYQERLMSFTPKPGTLSLLRLSLLDRQYIAAVAQGAAVDLAPFRGEPAADVEPVQAGAAVQHEAQRPPRAARRAAARK